MHDHLIIKPEFSLDEAWNQVFHELKRATVDPRHPFRNFWVSTIDENGRPNSRTVVLRKFTDENRILLYTDIRSDKAKELNKNPHAMLGFYHKHKRLQVKALGDAKIHHQNELSEQEWKESGHKGAHSYTSLTEPGKPLVTPGDAHHWKLDDPHNFSVIEIRICEWEFLQLNGTQHLRSKKTDSKMNWIAP